MRTSMMPQSVREYWKKRRATERKTKVLWSGVERVVGPKFVLDVARRHFEASSEEAGGVVKGYIVNLNNKKTMILAPQLNRSLFRGAGPTYALPSKEMHVSDKAAGVHMHNENHVGGMRGDLKHSKAFRTPELVVAKKNAKIAIPARYGDKTKGWKYANVPEGKVVNVSLLPDEKIWKLIRQSRKQC